MKKIVFWIFIILSFFFINARSEASEKKEGVMLNDKFLDVENEKIMTEKDYDSYFSQKMDGMNLEGVSASMHSMAFLRAPQYGNGVNFDLWMPVLPNVYFYWKAANLNRGWFKGWVKVFFSQIDNNNKQNITAKADKDRSGDFVPYQKIQLEEYPFQHINGWFIGPTKGEAWINGGDYRIAPEIGRFKGTVRFFLPVGKKTLHQFDKSSVGTSKNLLGNKFTVKKFENTSIEIEIESNSQELAWTIMENLQPKINEKNGIPEFSFHQINQSGNKYTYKTYSFFFGDANKHKNDQLMVDQYEIFLPDSVLIKNVDFDAVSTKRTPLIEKWKTKKRKLTSTQKEVIDSFFDFKKTILEKGNIEGFKEYAKKMYPGTDVIAEVAGAGKTYSSIGELMSQMLNYDFEEIWTSREKMEASATVWLEKDGFIEIITSHFERRDQSNEADNPGNHHIYFRKMDGKWMPIFSRLDKNLK